MGEPDLRFKEYFHDPARCADLANAIFNPGSQLIFPDDIHFLPTEKIFSGYGGGVLQRLEDVVAGVTRFTDGHREYAVIDLEGQRDVDCTAVFRIMIYCGLEYLDQCSRLRYDEAQRKVTDARARGEIQPEIQEHYRPALRVGEKVHPVVNIIVQLDPGSWTAYRTVYDALNPADGTLRNAAFNFGYHVVCPREMSDADFDGFGTDLGKVLKFIKYSGSKKNLAALIENDADYRTLRRDAAYLLSSVAKIPLSTENQEGGTVDMCQAVQEMIDDAVNDAVNNAVNDAMRNAARVMIQERVSVQLIRRVTNVSMEDLERLAQEENLPLV